MILHGDAQTGAAQPGRRLRRTTLLDVLARLTARADKFDAISTAAIFRLIDATHPTLLIDEADNLGLALRRMGGLGQSSIVGIVTAG
jgi:hypothetical protein